MIAVRVHQGRLEARGAGPADHDQLIDLCDLWEERAAILEFEAGFTKFEAEDLALSDLTDKANRTRLRRSARRSRESEKMREHGGHGRRGPS